MNFEIQLNPMDKNLPSIPVIKKYSDGHIETVGIIFRVKNKMTYQDERFGPLDLDDSIDTTIACGLIKYYILECEKTRPPELDNEEDN